MTDKIEFIPGAIYFISYGQTQIIGRYDSSDTCNYIFNDLIHYWNGYESFRSGNNPCVKSGIVEIRRANLPEKHILIRFQIEHETI
jgi:hypothetical protein